MVATMSYTKGLERGKISLGRLDVEPTCEQQCHEQSLVGIQIVEESFECTFGRSFKSLFWDDM